MRLPRLFVRRRSKAPHKRRIPDGLRLYAIGDIHGRADLLSRITDLVLADLRSHPPPKKMLTVFLGDYVDRGMDSRAVLDRLAGFDFPTPTWFLRGNHEAMMLSFLDDSGSGQVWIENGGLETLHSYGIDITGVRTGRRLEEAREEFRRILPPSHIAFIERTGLSFISGDYFFCHAGARPGIPLSLQKPEDLLWIREEFTESDFMFEK